MEEYVIANFLFLTPSLTLCVMLHLINHFLDKLKQESDEKNEKNEVFFLEGLSTKMYLGLVSVCYSNGKYDRVSLRVITDIVNGKDVY